jgi:hypothetical protein
MSVWNKVLLGLIGVVAVVLFYMAGRTLKTQTYWCDCARTKEAEIERLQKENRTLEEGSGDQGGQQQLGIRQVRMELSKLLLDRRRVWFKCEPKLPIKVGREDGSAEITLNIEIPKTNPADTSPDKPVAHGIAVSTVLYGFSAADVQKKGVYLGEFVTTNVTDKQVTLRPTDKLTPREIDRLENAKEPWILYELLPHDNHDIFADMSDEQKKALLSAFSPETLKEYLKDGRPSAKDDPKECVVDMKYVRPLRDYRFLLDAEREKIVLLTDSLATAILDKKLVDDALAEAKKQEEACKRNIGTATQDLAKQGLVRDGVEAYRKSLDENLTSVQTAIARFIDSNKVMAGQIAKFQLEAARLIDQRTRAMAQSGAGR